MLKKYISYLGVLVLACFSFYYTDRAADIVKRNDPIMKSILKDSSQYYVDSVSAIINGDEIIPGINGKKINVNRSYQKMKKYNIYDESMYVFSDVIPDISFINNYDKYIISGNTAKKQLSLIFKINDYSYVDELNEILSNKGVVANFFIDGSIIENNIDSVIELSNSGNEIENLGYDGIYSVEKFGWTNNLISSITGVDTKFCYTDYKNSNILDLCSSYRMYTVKPTVVISNYPFAISKKNISNGNIISFNINNELLRELPSIITYIKQKGYDIITLNKLISENLVDEK